MLINVDTVDIYEMRRAAGMVCHDHPTYRGLRKPRNGRNCPMCLEIYNRRVESGAKERKIRQRGRVRKQKGRGESLSQEGLKAYKAVVDSRVIDTAERDDLVGNMVAHLTQLNFEKHLNGEA